MLSGDQIKKMVGQRVWHVWRRREVLTLFWWGKVKERSYLEDLGLEESY